MQNSFTTAGLQDLLRFPIRDAESRKRFAVAAAINLSAFLVPIIPWVFMLGYVGTIMRQIISGEERPSMPEWKDWNGFLSLGAKLLGVNLIYSLPVFAPMGIGYILFLLPAFSAGFEGNTRNPELLAKFMAYSMLGTLGGMALFGIGMLLSLALWLIIPPAMAHAAARNSFTAGFHVREWWQIFRANLGGYLATVILMGGLLMLMMILMQVIYMTLVLCIVLPFLLAAAGAYVSMIIFALFAYAYREGNAKLEGKVTAADHPLAPASTT